MIPDVEKILTITRTSNYFDALLIILACELKSNITEVYINTHFYLITYLRCAQYLVSLDLKALLG